MNKRTEFIILPIFAFLLTSCTRDDSPTSAAVEPPVLLWSHSYGWGETYGIHVVDDGYLLLRSDYEIENNVYVGYVYLQKVDLVGNSLWQSQLFSGLSVRIESCNPTWDNGFIITGSQEVESNIDRILLARTDAIGNLIWQRTYGDTADNSGADVVRCPDGGFIIAANRHTPYGSSIYWFGTLLMKVDENGDSLWSTQFDSVDVAGICLTPDGGFILSGSRPNFETLTSDLWVAETADDGTLLWEQTYNIYEEEYPVGIEVAPEGYVILGQYEEMLAELKLFLAKISHTGELCWSHEFAESDVNWGKQVRVTSDGGYVIVGQFRVPEIYISRGMFLKTTSMGYEIWRLIIDEGAGTSICDVRETAIGGYILGMEGSGDVYLKCFE
jgi:hypothetical protein